MRTHGTLAKWNDDRGFGFISPASGGAEIFVHVSAFPRDGRRPTPGELVSYETETGADRKTRAVKIMRPGQQARGRPARRIDRERASLRVVETVIAVLLLGGGLGYAYSRMHKTESPPASAPRASVAETAPSPFKCDGRTMCSQMTSCAEARYFVQHCPNTKLDGNGGGEPCEQQWCNAD